jgi:hypothetical protein
MTAVSAIPRKNTSGNFRVLSLVSPAVCASDSNPAYEKKSGAKLAAKPLHPCVKNGE